MKGSELFLVIPRQRILSSLDTGFAGPWDLLVMDGCVQAQLQAVFFCTFPHWDAPVCQGAVVLDFKQYLPKRLDWSHSIFLLEDYASLRCLYHPHTVLALSHRPQSGRQMCLFAHMHVNLKMKKPLQNRHNKRKLKALSLTHTHAHTYSGRYGLPVAKHWNKQECLVLLNIFGQFS